MGCGPSKSAAVYPAANVRGRTTLVQPRSATATTARATATASSGSTLQNTTGQPGAALLELVARVCLATGDTSTANQNQRTTNRTSNSSRHRDSHSLEELVRALAREDVGRHIDHVSEDGRTCLSVASQHGHAGMVRALLQRGANPNIRLRDGDTAAHVAAAHGHMVVLFTLIDSGAEIAARNKHGHTVSDRAKHALADARGVRVHEATLCDKHHQQWQAALRAIFALSWQEEARQVLAIVNRTAPSPAASIAATPTTTTTAVASTSAGSPCSTLGRAHVRAGGAEHGLQEQQPSQTLPSEQARGPSDNVDVTERRRGDARVNRESVDATASLSSRRSSDLRASQGASTDSFRLSVSPPPPNAGMEDLSSQFSKGTGTQTSTAARTASRGAGAENTTGATRSSRSGRGAGDGRSSSSTGRGSVASSGVVRPRQILVSTPSSEQSSGAAEGTVFGAGALGELFGLCNALLRVSEPGTFIKQDSGFVTEDMASEDGDAEYTPRTLPSGAARLQVPEPLASTSSPTNTSVRSSGAHTPRSAADKDWHTGGAPGRSSAAQGRQQAQQRHEEHGDAVRKALRGVAHYNRLLMEFVPWQITPDSAAALSCADWELLQQLSQAHACRLVRAVASWCCALHSVHRHCGTVIPSSPSAPPAALASSSSSADNAKSSAALHFPVAKKATNHTAPGAEGANSAAVEALKHTWCALTLYEAVTGQSPSNTNGAKSASNSSSDNKQATDESSLV